MRLQELGDVTVGQVVWGAVAFWAGYTVGPMVLLVVFALAVKT